MKKILFILLFFPFIISSQNINYSGKYTCHIDGGETSETLVLIDTDYPFAYIKFWIWEDYEDGREPDGFWKTGYEYLTNIKITNNKFYSSQYNGHFVITQQDTSILMINSPYNDTCSYYLEGNLDYMSIVSIYKFDKYTLSSLVRMKDLDLKIMRNGIFARHGYIFISGGEMDKYFRSKEWYIPKFNNINHLLSDIEKHNIQLIKQLEK